MAKSKNCAVEMRLCLEPEANEVVEVYKTFVKTRERKATYSKEKAINRIIREFGEDRHLTLDVIKKETA